MGKDRTRVMASVFTGAMVVLLGLHVLAPRLVPAFLRLGVLPRTQTLLLVGSDINFAAGSHERLAAPGRSDTIILLKIRPQRSQLNILSIPRDSLVDVPGYGDQKINATFALGGISLLKQTVEKLTEIHVDRYLVLRPDSVRQLIDQMGGIKVYVDRDMYYVDHWGGLFIDLKKGWHWLNGRQLQGFLRFRRESTGDIRRIERQQEFLVGLSSGSFRSRSLFHIPRSILALPHLVQTNLKLREIVAWGELLRMLPAHRISRHVVPGNSASGENGASVWQLDYTGLRQILASDFGVRP